MYPNSTTECHPLFTCLLSPFLHRSSDVSTQLRDQNCDTSSLSGSDTPFTVPALALCPPCTPTSSCLSATPISSSLTSWDSWSSFESTDDEDNNVSSILTQSYCLVTVTSLGLMMMIIKRWKRKMRMSVCP